MTSPFPLPVSRQHGLSARLAEFMPILYRAAMFAIAAIAAVTTAAAAPSRSTESTRFAAMTAQYWRTAAVMDVAAAYRLLRDNHPGASPDMQDSEFRTALAEAHALAARRAVTVASFDGYAATLSAFANSFHDAHVRARPILRVARPDWASLVMALRGDRWVVVDEVRVYDTPLVGATLIGCDGIGAEAMARDRLGGFRIDWQVRAQRMQAAAWLLVDESNPYLKRPVSCVFERDGRRKTVALRWTSIALPLLLTRMDKNAPYGASGFGVRAAGNGYWIAVQSFSEGALPVVEQVKAMAPALRRAPFIVLDVRGNAGGSSSFGEDIATALVGAPFVAAKSGGATCATSYRATAGNIATFQTLRATFGPARGPAWTAIIDGIIDSLTTARAAGRAFTGPLVCPASPAAPLDAASSYAGRLFVLTDNQCFSACLAVVDLWRRLGATQLGQDTSANTTYIEVSEPLLPSGQATFSTLIGVSPGAPGESRRLGPFVPARIFTGDIADTAAVERWVLDVATRRRPGTQLDGG